MRDTAAAYLAPRGCSRRMASLGLPAADSARQRNCARMRWLACSMRTTGDRSGTGVEQNMHTIGKHEYGDSDPAGMYVMGASRFAPTDLAAAPAPAVGSAVVPDVMDAMVVTPHVATTFSSTAHVESMEPFRRELPWERCSSRDGRNHRHKPMTT